MIYFRKNLVFTLALLLLHFSATAQEQVNLPQVYAFTNVNVIPMDTEEVLENYTVIVENGRITKVSPAGEAKIPQGGEEIDGRGRYLLPGLTEMHGHIPGEEEQEYAENVLFLYVANGITVVRNMLGNTYHLKLRERVNSGEIIGPTIFAASPWLGPENAPDPKVADRIVREYKSAGFDLLKIGSINKETYKQIARTAHEINIPFGGHIPAEVGLEGALEAGQKSIDHYDRYVEFLVPEDANTANRNNGFFGSGLIDLIDHDRISLAVQKTVNSDTWNVPTLSLVEHLASERPAEEMITRPEMRYMPRDVLNRWVKFKNEYKKREDFQPEATKALVTLRRELTRRLHDAGAPIVLGSDAPQFFNVPGFSIHHELEMMVASGLTPYEVLVTGTRNTAEYFGNPEEFGTVQPGRRADLILLDSNPLEEISNMQDRAGVMLRGVWFPEVTIRERLEDIAEWAGEN